MLCELTYLECLVLSCLVLPCPVLSHLISSHLISSISSHLISSNFISSHLILSYLISTNNLTTLEGHWHCVIQLQYIPRNMHTVFALLCFVVVIHWLIFPYPSGLLHWHCGNLTIAPVPAKQPWWIWINTSCEFIMNDCITTTKQSTTKPCAYFLGYTVFFGGVEVHNTQTTWFTYSISQELYTRFCCALLCCGYVIVHNEFTWSIYPYSSGLLCWHWGYR